MMKRLVTLLRFSSVSLIGTAIDFLVLWVLVHYTGMSVVPANLIASEASIINSFVWNNAWAFRSRPVMGSLPRRFAAFNLMYAGGLVLSLALIWVLSTLFGARYYLL